MKKKVAAIVVGVLILGAVIFTQIPALKVKADTNNENYGYGYGMMGRDFNYKAMYDYMKGLSPKDVQNIMGGNISEKDARNMLNACSDALQNEANNQ